MKKEIANLTRARISDPKSFRKALLNRKRRDHLTTDGKLLLIAADHPARGALRAGTQELAMANRIELLSRLLLALKNCDGVLAAPDIIEDLAFLGALENKVVIGTTNRGGISGAQWELDDRMTAYDAAHIEELGLDGGKALLRIAHNDAGTINTIQACAKLVTELSDRKLIAMIEPLPYELIIDSEGGKVARLLKDEKQLIAATAIASGLGASSAFTWLKLPAWSQTALMAQTTTLPILLLGGEISGDLHQSLDTWKSALHNPIRELQGLVIGRTLLYPRFEGSTGEAIDVEYAIKAAALVVRP
jgi:hypothetical protein